MGFYNRGGEAATGLRGASLPPLERSWPAPPQEVGALGCMRLADLCSTPDMLAKPGLESWWNFEESGDLMRNCSDR